jgi:hypothetical protein
VTLAFMRPELNVVGQWYRAVPEVLSGIPAIEVSIETDACQITVEEGITVTAPRQTSRDITPAQASSYGPSQAAGRNQNRNRQRSPCEASALDHLGIPHLIEDVRDPIGALDRGQERANGEARALGPPADRDDVGHFVLVRDVHRGPRAHANLEVALPRAVGGDGCVDLSNEGGRFCMSEPSQDAELVGHARILTSWSLPGRSPAAAIRTLVRIRSPGLRVDAPIGSGRLAAMTCWWPIALRRHRMNVQGG